MILSIGWRCTYAPFRSLYRPPSSLNCKSTYRKTHQQRYRVLNPQIRAPPELYSHLDSSNTQPVNQKKEKQIKMARFPTLALATILLASSVQFSSAGPIPSEEIAADVEAPLKTCAAGFVFWTCPNDCLCGTLPNSCWYCD